MDAFTDARRILRVAGVVVWLMVGAPHLFQRVIDPIRLLVWVAAYFAFLALFLASTSVSATRIRLFLVLEVAATIAMVFLLCDGFEGGLLVLVALQAGGRLPRTAGVAWVLVASLLLGIAIAIHWKLSSAVLLVPAYFGFQLLALLISDLMSREALAKNELTVANRELEATRGLAEENARLAERVRISRELHDMVGHHLTALSLNLEAAAVQVEGPAIEPVQTARSLAKVLLEDVRGVVGALREGERERTELADALNAIVAEIPRPKIHLTLPSGLKIDDPEIALTVLRCTQEIVTNAARHADADNLWIELLQYQGRVELRARDDGRGALPLLQGNGLTIMRERVEGRGGRLEIESSPGSGFLVRAAIPIQRPVW